MKPLLIGLIGERSDDVIAHRAIPAALQLAHDKLRIPVTAVWINTQDAFANGEERFAPLDGMWCTPGSPYANMDGALNAIRFAREHNLPFFGTCGGFQHALIEFARSVLGKAAADHEESAPNASLWVVSRLSCSLVEQRGRIQPIPGTRTAKILGGGEIDEEYHCNFGLNPAARAIFKDSALRFSGVDNDGEVRIFELDDHPFFFGTLFQPERTALKGVLHPLIEAFVAAAAKYSGADTPSTKSEVRNSK